MNGQERIFETLNGVDEQLLERSEREQKSRRHWLSLGAALAACLALTLLIWTAERPAAPPDVTPNGPQQYPVESVLPESAPSWVKSDGEFHYLQTCVAETGLPETRFRIWINREIYYSYEQNGVYIIRPRQEPEIPDETLPPCRLEITHLPDTSVKQAALLVQERLTGEYQQAEELLVPPNGWFQVGQGEAYLCASDGVEWNAAQCEVWIQPDGANGAFVLESRYFLEAAEGHGARFADMMTLFSPEADGPKDWTDPVTELRDTGERLAEAVFANDLTSVTDLLTADADVNGCGDNVSGEVSIASMDCAMDYEGNAAEISVKHRVSGEEPYRFLTIQLRREDDGQWRASFIGLEK